MNEQEEKKAVEEIFGRWKQEIGLTYADLQNLPGPLANLLNQDGSINLSSAIKVLKSKDPQIKKWREENNVQSIANNLGIELGQEGLKFALEGAKFGLGLNQFNRGKSIDTTEPQYPGFGPDNTNLQIGLDQTSRAMNEGMSLPERAILDEERRRGLAGARANLIRQSGGQSGLTAAGNQIAAYRDQLNRLNQAAIMNTERGRGRQQFLQATSMDLQQDRDRRRQQQNQFRFRTMPLFQNRMNERRRLMNSGVQNMFGAAGNIVQGANQLSDRFLSNDLPENIYPTIGLPKTYDPPLQNGRPQNAIQNVDDMLNNLQVNPYSNLS